VCSGYYDTVSLRNLGFIFSLYCKAAKELRLSQAQDKKLVKNFGNLSFISTYEPSEYFLLKAAVFHPRKHHAQENNYTEVDVFPKNELAIGTPKKETLFKK
jgi:hypothetical protein